MKGKSWSSLELKSLVNYYIRCSGDHVTWTFFYAKSVAIAGAKRRATVIMPANIYDIGANCKCMGREIDAPPLMVPHHL